MTSCHICTVPHNITHHVVYKPSMCTIIIGLLLSSPLPSSLCTKQLPLDKIMSYYSNLRSLLNVLVLTYFIHWLRLIQLCHFQHMISCDIFFLVCPTLSLHLWLPVLFSVTHLLFVHWGLPLIYLMLYAFIWLAGSFISSTLDQTIQLLTHLFFVVRAALP